MGIPMVGCDCPVCRSANPKDRRLRCSALLNIGGKLILIDTSPDFRYQALRIGLTRLDGVIWTHAHQDHSGGIDDLRPLFLRNHHSLPCLLSEATYKDFKNRYNYLFSPPDKNNPSLRPKFDLNLISQQGEIDFLGIPIEFFSYLQVGMEVTGLRFGPFAYVTDLKDYDDSIFERLKGVETLVVSALRYESSPLHLTLDEAVAFGKTVGAKKTYFTHMAHEIGHDEGSRRLPSGFALAYDGLEIPIHS
jgi:phosphoribosyl 1,2-cyclic phosphate phosphodiesterase